MPREHQTPTPQFLSCFAGRQRLTAREVAMRLDISTESARDHACALCADGLLKTYADEIPARFHITAKGLDSIWTGLQHVPGLDAAIVRQARASRSALEVAWGAGLHAAEIFNSGVTREA